MLKCVFPSILFTILALLWMTTQLDAQGCSNTDLRLKTTPILSDDCDAFLSNNAEVPLCGRLDDQGAARACFDTGINHEGGDITNRRQYRCEYYTEGDLARLVEDLTYFEVNGVLDYACLSPGQGDPDCFANCYMGGNATYNETGNMGDCGGEVHQTAVDCKDINECNEGVLKDCTGPFDFDCVCAIPCGPGAKCANTIGGYTCSCLDGYNDTHAYNTIGCVDLNECEEETDECSDNEICENTIGSYYCLCEAYNGLFRGEAPKACDLGNCNTTHLPDIDNSNGWSGGEDYKQSQVTVCEDGFEPSLSNNSVSTECRNDGKWCQCSSLTCQRKRCGIPHHDGNADVKSEDGVGLTGTSLTYECLEGFNAGDEDEYEILCENSGAWEGVDLRCSDENECSDKNICPEHSDCINTIGSYYCHCHPGFEGNCTEKARVSCGEVPIVAHAQRSSVPADEIGRYEDVVNYRCDEGYHVSTKSNPHSVERDFEITCKLDKCWTPSPIPHCVPIMCGDPGDLKHASRAGGSFHYKSKVSYTCHDGFELSGYHTTEYNKIKTFEMTCEKDGWTEKHYCEDINECKDYDHPCGVGGRHHCINRKGSYTCSCAPGFRVDKTGRQCIGLPTDDIQDVTDPCEVFRTLGFCKHGECALDGAGTPRCSCRDGYRGTFCDRGQPMDHSRAFIMAIVDIVVGSVSLLVTILLACCVCSRQHNSRGHPRPSPTHPGSYPSHHAVGPPPVYARHSPVRNQYMARFQGPFVQGFYPRVLH